MSTVCVVGCTTMIQFLKNIFRQNLRGDDVKVPYVYFYAILLTFLFLTFISEVLYHLGSVLALLIGNS